MTGVQTCALPISVVVGGSAFVVVGATVVMLAPVDYIFRLNLGRITGACGVGCNNTLPFQTQSSVCRARAKHLACLIIVFA